MEQQVVEQIQKPDIFSYLNYQEFLTDFYQYKKKTKRYFSYSTWAAQAGLKSKSTLKMVIYGNRALSLPVALKIAKSCDFTENENEYFIQLVHYSRTKDQEEKGRILNRLEAMGPVAQTKVYNKEKLRILSKWYYLPLLEMLNLKSLSFSLNALKNKILYHLSPYEIEEAYQVLMRHGLIENKNGSLKPKYSNIAFETLTSEKDMKKHHVNMMKLAVKSLEVSSMEEREFGSVTLGVNEEDIEKIKELSVEFQEKIISYVNRKGSTDRVYQMNLQFFPVTKGEKS